MSDHLKNYLSCVCHDRLYLLGIVDLQERQRAIAYIMTGGGVSIIVDKPLVNGHKRTALFSPDYKLGECLSLMGIE